VQSGVNNAEMEGLSASAQATEGQPPASWWPRGGNSGNGGFCGCAEYTGGCARFGTSGFGEAVPCLTHVATGIK
jgi:hypothetical protein